MAYFSAGSVALPKRIALTSGHESLVELRQLAANMTGAWLILRHYHHPQRTQFAHHLARICRQHSTGLLIAGDARLAHDAGALGVHYPAFQVKGQAGLMPHFGGDWIISAAVHSLAELRRAEAKGAGLGLLAPVFSAPSGGSLLGVAGFARLARQTEMPLFALGGVSAQNFPPLRRAGAAGFAAIRAFAARESLKSGIES